STPSSVSPFTTEKVRTAAGAGRLLTMFSPTLVLAAGSLPRCPALPHPSGDRVACVSQQRSRLASCPRCGVTGSLASMAVTLTGINR
ncbi:MAG: hypothetical protein M3325_18680, partial [Actinomycetota bacterium]|nr:hypothetical protein [Actinomycetota bacterium]